MDGGVLLQELLQLRSEVRQGEVKGEMEMEEITSIVETGNCLAAGGGGGAAAAAAV
jgi:hypothetical protein